MPRTTQEAQPWIRPEKCVKISLDQFFLFKTMDQAPLENSAEAKQNPTIISIPMPDGTFEKFSIVLSPLMEPELAAKYPHIQTYAGQGLDDPASNIRLGWNTSGFHAQIISPKGRVFIDPWSARDTTHYSSYYTKDYRNAEKQFSCLVDEVRSSYKIPEKNDQEPGLTNFGGTLRTYVSPLQQQVNILNFTLIGVQPPCQQS